jgi:hypothetical protein
MPAEDYMAQAKLGEESRSKNTPKLKVKTRMSQTQAAVERFVPSEDLPIP